MAAIIFNVLPLIPYLSVFISFSFLWWAVRGSACSAGGRCGASRLARCAGKRSRVYSAPRPDGFEPMPWQQKSDRPESIAFYSMVGRQGFSLLRRRPLRRFAPCALRWQTLTRLLSSAPRRVRTHALATKKRPTGVDRLLFYGGPSGVRTLDLGIKSPLLCQLS